MLVVETGCSRKKPRIAIAGLGIESSTFSPALSDEAAFHAKYDTAVFSNYPFMAPDSPIRKRAVWVPILVGHALPARRVHDRLGRDPLAAGQ